eukprot:11909676-Karenia_brevis.AAC.1
MEALEVCWEVASSGGGEGNGGLWWKVAMEDGTRLIFHTFLILSGKATETLLKQTSQCLQGKATKLFKKKGYGNKKHSGMAA